jgi:hypothetical protein
MFGYEFNVPGRTMLQKYAFHPYVQSLIKTLLKTVAHMDPRKIETNVCPVYPVQSASNIKIPCFFIHCKNDEKVSVEAIKAVYDHAAGPKALWVTNGRNHFDSYFYNPERYVEKVRQFVDQVLAGTWSKTNAQGMVDVDQDDNKKLVG